MAYSFSVKEGKRSLLIEMKDFAAKSHFDLMISDEAIMGKGHFIDCFNVQSRLFRGR